MEKRKRGRPPIPKNVEEYCITEAMKHPDMPRKELAAKVEMELKAMQHKPPGKDKMLKLFQMAPEPGAEDMPWSVAKSLIYRLSPDATGDLLRVLAFCLAAGREFTIRQAKWACYLRTAPYGWVKGTVNKLEIADLYNFSVEYANRERICEALKIDTDTTNMDVELAMSWAEFITALKTEMITKNQLHHLPENLPQAGISEVKRLDDVYWTVFDDLGLQVQRDTIFLPDIPEEVPRIYAYWLRFISKTQKWVALSLKEKQDIALKLKKDIELAAVEPERSADFSDGKWVPVEILRVLAGC